MVETDDALRLVQGFMGPDAPADLDVMRQEWIVEDYREGSLVAPREDTMGSPLFLVLRGDVEPVVLAFERLDDVYEQLDQRTAGTRS